MDPLIANDRDFLMAEKIRLERENAKLRADLATACKHPSDEVNAKYIVPVQLALAAERAEVDRLRSSLKNLHDLLGVAGQRSVARDLINSALEPETTNEHTTNPR